MTCYPHCISIDKRDPRQSEDPFRCVARGTLKILSCSCSVYLATHTYLELLLIDLSCICCSVDECSSFFSGCRIVRSKCCSSLALRYAVRRSPANCICIVCCASYICEISCVVALVCCKISVQECNSFCTGYLAIRIERCVGLAGCDTILNSPVNSLCIVCIRIYISKFSRGFAVSECREACNPRFYSSPKEGLSVTLSEGTV